jgi:hypothetical protein
LSLAGFWQNEAKFVNKINARTPAIAPAASGSMLFGTLAHIYVLGFVAAPFLPETKGKPLPEDV